MTNAPLLKQIKTMPYIFLLIIIANLVISFSAIYSSIGKVQIVAVNVEALKTKTSQQIAISTNSFHTGFEGRLFWKVKNVKEAFLVAVADREHSTNFYDLTYLLILNIALFVMVHKINEKSIFSSQLFWGLRLIAASVMLYPFIQLLAYKIAGHSIETLTNGQFTAPLKNSNVFMYLILTYLLLFLAPFMKKAIDYQNEKNLTI